MKLVASVEAAMLAHARETAPEECCGLLVGRPAEIVEAVRARNMAEEPRRRYLIDPRDHLGTIRDARARGLDVVGAYHSHPHSPARPSTTDIAEGFGDFVFLIVGLAANEPEVTGWAWSDGNFAPLPLVRCP